MSSNNKTISTRRRRIKTSNTDTDRTVFFTNKCDEIVANKSKQELESNIICTSNKKDSKINRRFYYKNGLKNIYLGTEIDFNNCITKYNQNQRQEEDIIDKTEFKTDKCKKNDNHKAELLDYLYEIKLNKKLYKIDDDIYNFLKYLINKTNIDTASFDEIMKGAFVIIKDDGAFYREFLHVGRMIEYESSISGIDIPNGMSIHKSSHWSGELQYRLGSGQLVLKNSSKTNNSFDLLVGTSILPNFNDCTWFQFENSRITGAISFLEHGVDFVKYKTGIIQGNIGPFGTSKYTELNYLGPLLLGICDDLENCLFEDESPIIKTKKYWLEHPLTIEDYSSLTNIIYKAGNSIPSTFGLNIRHYIGDKYLRYKTTTKTPDEILINIRDNLVEVNDLYLSSILKHCFENIQDIPLFIPDEGLKVDLLLMYLFNYIFICIKVEYPNYGTYGGVKKHKRNIPKNIKTRKNKRK